MSGSLGHVFTRRIFAARALRRLLVLSAAASLGACAAVRESPPAPAAASTAGRAVQVLDRLYFGRNIPAGGSVSERDWAAFLAEVVTPRFPAGLTAWPAGGQWRSADGTIVHELSFVLELIHPDGAATERAVREIADEYKRRFSQEAVLRVRDRVEVSF